MQEIKKWFLLVGLMCLVFGVVLSVGVIDLLLALMVVFIGGFLGLCVLMLIFYRLWCIKQELLCVWLSQPPQVDPRS